MNIFKPFFLFSPLLASAFFIADPELNIGHEVAIYQSIEKEAMEADYTDERDLEEMAQDFVLETKQISILGYPDAFNPSITWYNGQRLMCFRTYHPQTRATNRIGLVYLNEEFEPIGTPKILEFRSPDPYCLSKRQDPRLFTIDEQLYIAYNNAIHGEVRRMLIAKIEFEKDAPVVYSSECLIDFEGERDARAEKNWVPFSYEGDLHLAYSIVPHRILRPIGLNYAETVACTLPSLKWHWGVLRGGTPALLESDEYLAFFHSVKSMATKHSQGKSIPHYFMGAYTFSKEPPFQITKISPEPIVGKTFYSPPYYKTWKPCRVVFPGGFLKDEKFIWVLYGRQDHEIWVVKLDKEGLFNHLVPVL